LRIGTGERRWCRQLFLRLRPRNGGSTLLHPDSRVLTLGGQTTPGTSAVTVGQWLARLREAERTPCFAVALASAAAARAFLLGIGGPVPDYPYARTDGRELELGFQVDRELAGAAAAEYELAAGAAADPFALLESYGDLLGRYGRRPGARVTGWNSWDYYAASVTMDDVRSEMAAIAASPLAGRLRHVCIDMGWEQAWGDWRPNRKFPDTHAQIAAEIRAAGFEPGIWTAPLQASVYLPSIRHRRELLAVGDDGEPAVVPGGPANAVFDPTHPEARQYWAEVFAALRAAGFTFFKIDYIYRQYIDAIARLHDPAVGKAAAIRSLLATIRAAIGDESHLLSCGAPLESALGLADSARICTDIHNFWSHVKANAAQLASAYWMHGRLWENDPDFAIVRSRATSADPYLNIPYRRHPLAPGGGHWMAGPEASFEELKTWLALVYLSGGSLFVSDSIPRLNPLGLATLVRLFSGPRQAARPADLFVSATAQTWIGRQERGGGTLGLFNWDDAPARVEVPRGVDAPTAGRDVWTDQPVSVGGGVTLPAHGSLLLSW